MPDTYTLLEKVVVGAAGASSITFTSIPQTYTDLLIKVSARSARAGQQADNLFITFNNDTTSYSARVLQGNGTSASSSSQIARYASLAVDAAGSTASTFSSHDIYIPNYTGSANKSFSADNVSENNATAAQSDLVAGLWSNTAAITSIALQPEVSTWVQYSTFYLYGVAKLGVTPTSAPKATGGDRIVTDGTYWYHAFLSSSTFTPKQALSCDVLVVAGGGAGGGTVAGGGDGGGGGAGGLSYRTTASMISNTNYTVTVGGGGSGQSGTTGTTGSNSVFNGITSNGGGGGGGNGGSGVAGGSGGGGGANNGAGGASNQGNTGGATGYGNAGGSSTNWAYNISGGGGAGAVGVSGNAAPSTSTVAPNGGAGLNTWSSWASATGTGVSGYYAGGGAGGKDSTVAGAAGTGGVGGGGNGGVGTGALQPTTGIANTGGGGGGGGGASSQNGANGGSGIVIVRYAV